METGSTVGSSGGHVRQFPGTDVIFPEDRIRTIFSISRNPNDTKHLSKIKKDWSSKDITLLMMRIVEGSVEPQVIKALCKYGIDLTVRESISKTGKIYSQSVKKMQHMTSVMEDYYEEERTVQLTRSLVQLASCGHPKLAQAFKELGIDDIDWAMQYYRHFGGGMNKFISNFYSGQEDDHLNAVQKNQNQSEDILSYYILGIECYFNKTHYDRLCKKIKKCFKLCDINSGCPDDNKYTPLQYAVMYRNLPAVQAFVENGARVNEYGELPVTPLMLAASKGYYDIVSYLSRRGANKYLRSKSGSKGTALDMAKLRRKSFAPDGFDRVIKLLQPKVG